jgi:malonate decarboxylase alpha subunit
MPNRLETKREKLLGVEKVFGAGKLIPSTRTTEFLELVVNSGDRLIHEGDNQKQGDFLAAQLAKMNPEKIRDLEICASCLGLPEHLDLFENGLASTVNFAYAGPQGGRLAEMVFDGRVKIGAIHTYVELYARYFAELIPDVACLVAIEADREGNLYTGANTEETPALIEAAAFRHAVVVVQANKIVDKVRRVDVPGSWVDFVVESPKPFHLEALFTKDPALVDETKILMAMIAMKAIYAKYLPRALNHGVGFNTAAIELLLPTYGEEIGLKGKACTHWALNPHPTMIPAIESGFVEAIACIGGEVGMDAYVAAHPNIFPLGPDGSLRSNRFFGQMTGHFADMFIGATLQIDPLGNSSTVTASRLVGFGGAPNFGAENRARRHLSKAFLVAGREAHAGEAMPQGRKLVVQIVETFQAANQPTFIERLEAWDAMQKAGFEIPPVMIYGDDVSHIVTEEGVANLLLCRTMEEREQAVRGVAGFTPVGLKRDHKAVENLRDRGVIQRAEDLGIRKTDVSRDRLAARSIHDLVRWSGGLYEPPSRFRNW